MGLIELHKPLKAEDFLQLMAGGGGVKAGGELQGPELVGRWGRSHEKTYG